MGIGVIGTSGGAGTIKSIQRGVSTVAESVTISVVDTTKTTVKSFPTASNGNVGFNLVNIGNSYLGNQTAYFGDSFAAGQYGAKLASSTSIVTDGPCRWEVIEYA